MNGRPELPPHHEPPLLRGGPTSADDPVREAWVLPLAFLTVSLGGGFRMMGDGSVRWLPPPLISLVLAMLLLAVLVRSGALEPRRLLAAERTPSQNLAGLVVLVTLFAASAQVFNAITPEAGLMHFLGNVFLISLLWNTAAAAPDARRMLRSLAVVVGAAFVLKFVLLAALYDPRGGLTRRVLTALLDGVTLGTIEYELHGPAVGYVIFFTVALYMVGLFLLPRRGVPQWR